MALPHPHGSSSGQIAHNSIYDTGVTPGSTGGKFIGWGEEGTSSNANRAHWALSENIDYVYQKMAANKAIPHGQAIAAGHGGISKYHLSGDIFVGDASYPTLESEGLMLLFAVMDEQYNELEDGSGHEVLVYLVRDTTETTNVYKYGSGFVTDPWVYFEANGSPYTIPDAQEVRLLYGEKGNLENLPVDAFTRFKLNSAAEAQAGVVLQDGTRPMTGNFNLDGYNIENPYAIIGKAGTDLTLYSYDDLLIHADQKMYLKDQYLSGLGVQLSQSGEASVYDTGYGQHWSIIKSLNSKTRVAEALCFPPSLAHGYENTVTMPGSGGIINWGATGIIEEGQFWLASAGSLNMASPMKGAGWYYLCTDGANVYTRPSGSLQTGDVALYYFNWDGANITEYRKLARPYNGRAAGLEITVGGRGCDFPSTALQEALNYVAHVGFVSGSADVVGTTVIKVKEGALWSTPLQIRSDVIIRGEGMYRTVLRSNCGTNNDAIKGNGFKVIMEDLTVQHDSDQMVSWVAMIRNFGPFSEFRRLCLKAGTTYNKNFSIAFLVDASEWAYYCTWDTIEAYDPLTTGFIRGCEFTLSSSRLEASTVRNCWIGLAASANYGILTIAQMTVIDSGFWADAAGGITDWGIVCGYESRIENTVIWGNVSPGVGIQFHWNGGEELFVWCTGCMIYDCEIGMRVQMNQVARYCAINICGGKIDGADTGVELDPLDLSTDSFVILDGVSFENINVRGVHCNHGNLKVRVHRCMFTSIYGMGVQCTAGPTEVNSCYFAGWGTGGALNNCVDFSAFSGAHKVTNCVFGTGAPSGGKYISTAAPVTVFGNQINGPGGTNTCIGVNLVGGSDNSYVGHNIIASVQYGVRVEGTFLIFIFGAGNRIEGNRFWGIPIDGWGILIDGAEVQTIIGNEFSGSDGGGIFVRHLSGGAIGDAKSNMIANNTFYSVRGEQTGWTTFSVIRVEEVSGSSRMTSITGNKLYLCGNAASLGGKINSQIYSSAADTHISGNYIAWQQGYANDSCNAIELRSTGSIIGNHIMHDWSTAGVPLPYTMVGIYTDQQKVMISNNYIDWKNTSASSTCVSQIAIYLSNSYCAVTGNVIRGWSSAGSPTRYAIYAPNLDNGVLVGNWTETHGIYFSGAFTPAIGNYGGSVSIVRTSGVNLYPESTLYNATAQSIFTDMNY
jgi:hypothetical protein